MLSTITLTDYHLTKLIYEGNDNRVWSGIRKKDNVPVVVKFLKNEYPTNEQIARFSYEYNLIKKLGKEVTVEAYDLLPHQNSLVMVLEAFGTGSLRELLAKRTLSPKDALSLAIKLAEALTQIQLHNVIHKDLNPANILVDEITEKVKIIDFGLATTLSHETPEVRTPNVLEGALAYISPEQTGRMNRGIDYRSDYYSLGVIFYEMFTGQLPFQSEDAVELVHCHIAKSPTPPFEVNENLPHIISDIIIKLLSKAPEERYQSTSGLKADLETCLEQLKEDGVIEPFPLGTKDFAYHFQIPEKLYGREFEIKSILESFDRISKGTSEFILIAGYAGIGKSSLVQEIHKPILEKKGWYIAGKFDKIRRDTPYFAILQAFNGLIQKILLESQSQINVWKKQIISTLEPNGQVMVEVLPILEELIGPQPDVPALNPKEAQNRFHLIFLNFIRSFTLAENPLAIFLDDLQWADLPSLKLLELFLTEPDIHYLLIIGAYRDNEVDAAHPLMITLDSLKKSNVSYETLLLRPLNLVDIQQLLTDSLHYEKKDVLELATLCLEKTQGNPFFLNQFLETLYENHFIKFNQTIGKWIFDINLIRKQDITENVVLLMIDKLKHLSSQAQETLRYASCIGNQFDLKTLSIVLEKPANEVTDELWESLREGFIVPLNENYKFVSEKEIEQALYKFLHDRVREAAYATIENSEKKRIHLKIGRLLLKKYSTPQQQEEKIFDIIQHLNMGAELVTEVMERTLLIRLNHLAGNKAFISAAYDSAHTYFHFGLSLLPKNSWKEDYALSLELHLKATETSYLLGRYDEMEILNAVILKNAKTLLDKVKVYDIRLRVYILKDELLKVISEGISVLENLGIKLPRKPNNFHIILKLIKIKWLLSGKKIENLIQLPARTDPYKLAAEPIFEVVATAGYFTMPLIYACCIFENLILCLKYGNTLQPSASYFAYGAVCCGILNEFEKGYAFGQVGLKLIEQYRIKNDEARSLIIFYGCIDHWKNPLKSGIAGLQNAYLRGLEVGAFEDASYAVIIYVLTAFYAGKELDKIAKDMEKWHVFFEHHEYKTTFAIFAIFRQMIQNLMNNRPDPWVFTGDFYDEEKYPYLHRQMQVHIALYVLYSGKGILSYLFCNETLAMSNFELAEPYKDSAMATFSRSAGFFFKTLTMLAIYANEEPVKKRKLLKSINKNIQIIKNWASFSPSNYLHKYYLLEAELSRVLGNFEVASNYYEKAITFSQKNEFLNDEALSYELTGKFYLAQDKMTIAQLYLTKAYHNYERWGATTKVQHLEKQYPFLIGKEKTDIAITSSLTFLTSSGSGTTLRGDILDLSTAMKASQAIASEVDLEELLKKLMNIVLENSGAEKGYLLLEENGEWVIDAEAKSNPKQITILQAASIEKLPFTIINRVIRKKETIILDDASESGEYINDLHIAGGKLKSILCMPLLSQNTLKGILYLENNLAPGVFTQDRLYLLETLSSQIVISIENAKLYSRLKVLNKAYERFVPYQFLKFLGKKEITDVKLGDRVEKEMTILFCDIRNFTTISEKLTPFENFAFINDFFKRAEPIISKYHGFIDKYIGDAIMALYPTNADDALKSAIALLNNLKGLNLGPDQKEPVNIGIGLNTGSLMLGTVGDEHRMEGTVISDAVNIASRIEDLTKKFETSLLISEDSYRRLQNPNQFAIRYIGDFSLKGKTKPVTIYEVFSADPESSRQLKQKTQGEFEQAVKLYQEKKFDAGLILFQKIVDLNPEDTAARNYKMLCASGIKLDVL